MNAWLIVAILTWGIVVINSKSKNGNQNLPSSSSLSYPKKLLDSVARCKIISKFPWLTTSSEDKMCKNVLYSNEHILDVNLLKSNYQSDDVDYDNSEQQQKELSNIFLNDKRGIIGAGMGCDCQIKNDLLDLGYPHFPRYLFNAVCQDNNVKSNSKISLDKKSHGRRCWRGSECKPVEYKVLVLTHRTTEDLNSLNDHSSSLLPDILRPDWKFKTVTVAAGCFCSF